ncbi:MAG: hypothetical protein WD993_06850 [Thermoleophilaceae bacterium]
MVEDGAVLGDKWLVRPDSDVTPRLVEAGYDVAELVGARMVRYHRGLEPDRPDALTLYVSRVDSWLADVERRGFEPYLTLTYQPDFWSLPPPGPDEQAFVERFGAFCGDVAARYAGRITRFGVWNEPNNRKWGGGLERRPRLYGVLFSECATAVRAVDPDATVAYGEIDAHRADACEYVDRSLTRPTVADALAIHTYQWTTPPERPLAGSSPCQGIGRLDDWHAARGDWASRGMIVTGGGVPPPLWITEHGYCAAAGECSARDNANSLDEATRADYLRRSFAWARLKGVEVFGQYHLFRQVPGDQLWDSGIVGLPADPALAPTPTPSVQALRQAVADDSTSLVSDLDPFPPSLRR